jgi:tetratricopeptide (TPR) repeat protein
MNLDYCFTKTVPGAFLFSILTLSACSSIPQTPDLTAADAPPDPVETVAEDDPEKQLSPTDADVMYHVFAAEVLGAEGDFSAAAEEYLEAALESEDPEIAERATRVAVSAGEWQMVALASDRWAMLQPQNLDARQLAAGSRLKEGDYVGAEYQLARILELTEFDQSRGWSIVAGLLASANDQVRAGKVLNNLLIDFDAGSNVEALFARSQMAARNGDMDTASDLIDQAIELEPGRATFLAWSGRLALSRKDNALALQRYQLAWKVDPTDQNISMAYAELLKRDDDLPAAQAVLAGLPDTPDMRFARIVFMLDARDRETAEQLYRGYADANYANKADAAFQAAQSAELLGHKREAIEWYRQVTGERSMRAILRQAFLLAELGDIGEARNLIAQLRIQTDQTVISQSYQAEAQILQNADRNDEAKQVLDAALEILPGDVTLRYNRALLAVSLGQLELAERDLRQIIAVEPDNAAALNALGYTLADLTDRYAEAEELILRAYGLQPQESSILDSMGWVAYRLERLPEAIKYLRQAWAMTQVAEIAAHLGEVLWVIGQEEEARAIWQSGLRTESDTETLVKTMQRFGVMP